MQIKQSESSSSNGTLLQNLKLSGIILIICLILLRLTTLDILPLIEPTEGRYATISQVMNQSGDFLTPRIIDHDGKTVPFLGKPPLLFWMVSFWNTRLDNIEFSARLPSFLAFLAVLSLMGFFMNTVYSKKVAIDSILILISSSVFFIFAGICQTDMLLATTHMLALISFYFFIQSRKQTDCSNVSFTSQFWAVSFFVALGLGMLIKGPVAIVLAALSIVLWLFWAKQWKILFNRSLINLTVVGLLVFFAIWTPWYLLAEKNNPGFLEYFLINENFLRYITTHYGDRYGSSHKVPHGTSWAYLFLGAMPWSFYLFRVSFVGKNRVSKELIKHLKESDKFIICWLIAPAIFFTFARSILVSYLVPAIPALTMLLTRILTSKTTITAIGQKQINRTTLALATTLILLSFACFTYGLQYSLIHLSSTPDSSLLLAAILWVASCISAARLFSKAQTSAIAPVALISVLTLCSATYSLRYFIGDNFSTSTLFSKANESDHPAIEHFNFPEGIPYTANLYSPLPLEAELDEMQFPESDEQEMIIIRHPKNGKVKNETLPDRNKSPLFKTGIWEAYDQEAFLSSHQDNGLR